MSVCPPYKDTLMLDILGELDPRRQEEWRQHLSGCPGCSAEKEAVTHTLGLTKTALEAPPLGEAEAAVMRRQVIQALSEKTKQTRVRQKPFFFSRGFVSAFAAACMVLIVLGIGTSELFNRSGTNQDAPLALVREQVPEDVIPIITNMDLLNDLDALSKLSKVIDQSDNAPVYNNVQGKYGHGEKTTLT